MKKILALLLCTLMCLAAACTKPAPEAQQPTDAPNAQTETPTQEAPDTSDDTELPDLDAGENHTIVPDLQFETVTLSGDAIGSEIIEQYDLVVVNYWAEWCGPCVGEMPAIEQLHQSYPNVLILGVWIGDDKASAQKTIADTGVTYPCIEVSGTLERYAERCMFIPTTFFFDRKGDEVGEQIVGSRSFEEWKQVVDSMLP